jgi:hypothetical protein
VDVVTDARGRLIAVYSRCTRRKYSCDVLTYSFSSRRERRARGVSRRGCDEFGPSVSRGVIVFGRGQRGRGRRARCKVGLYAKGRSRRSRARRLVRVAPLNTDVAGRTAAFSERFDEECCDQAGVRTIRLGVRRPRVRSLAESRIHDLPFCADEPCRTDATTDPVLDGRFIYARRLLDRTDLPGDGGRIMRLASGARRGEVFSEPGAPVFTVSAGRLFVADAAAGAIRRIDRPAFGTAAR